MNGVCIKVRKHSLQHYKQCFDEIFINGLIFLFYLPPHSPLYSLSFRRAASTEERMVQEMGGSLLKITSKGFSTACWRKESSITGIRYDQKDNHP